MKSRNPLAGNGTRRSLVPFVFLVFLLAALLSAGPAPAAAKNAAIRGAGPAPAQLLPGAGGDTAAAKEFPMPRLSPPPFSVEGVKVMRENLGGQWNFNSNPPDRFWEGSPSRDAGWASIHVPGEWTMQRFTVAKGKAAAYRRTFDVPADWAGRRVKLRCDAVYSTARVLVNGGEAGRHEGGFTPFELDVTSLVRPGTTNEIALAVENDSLSDILASATQYANHPLGGITRKIYLFALPAVNIAALDVETRFDSDYRDAVLRVLLEVANEGNEASKALSLSFGLAEVPTKAAVTLAPAEAVLPSIPPGGAIEKTIEIPIKNPRKWDCEHPNLYELTCVLEAGGKKVETVRRRIGFRQVEVRGCELYVNGSPVKLRGVNRHEVNPYLGRSLIGSIWKKDAALFKEANINFVRTSHYPPAEEFIEECDARGIFVEEEAPICWVGHGANPVWKKRDPGDPALLPYIVRPTLEMIRRDLSHPSVIIWSMANESRWGENFRRQAEIARAADSTRPLSFHDQAFGSYNNNGSDLDIAIMHYPGPGGPDQAAKDGRPVLYGEYCHVNTYNRRELVTDPGVRDDWGRGFHAMWEKIYKTKACLGGSIWAGVDDIFRLPSGKETGYGPWGIIDGFRRRKPEYWHVKKTYSPVKILERTVPLPEEGKPLEVAVENRFDFTNLSEVRSVWVMGRASGTIAVDIPPRQRGKAKIVLPAGTAPGSRLELKFLHPEGGYTIEDVYLTLGGARPAGGAEKAAEKTGTPEGVRPSETPAAAADKAGKEAAAAGDEEVHTLPVAGTEDALFVRGRGFTYKIDRKTGRIAADIGGRPVIVGGPVLMVLPLEGGPCAPNYSPHTPPLNDTLTGWTVEDVKAEKTASGEGAAEGGGKAGEKSGGKADAAGCARITVRGAYKEAHGAYTFTIANDGKLEVSYRFVMDEDVNPRQWGPVFSLPEDCEILEWKRDALWTKYSRFHIGRPEGKAAAHRGRRWAAATLGGIPAWPFAQDETPLGLADFRSTRENIRFVSLTAKDGAGVRVDSNGRQAARAWLAEDGSVRLLVAGFNTGGSDPFFSAHLRAERRPLKKGGVISDTVHIVLLGPEK